MVNETGPAVEAPPTLRTGVNPAALAAAVRPRVIEILAALWPTTETYSLELVSRPWSA